MAGVHVWLQLSLPVIEFSTYHSMSIVSTAQLRENTTRVPTRSVREYNMCSNDTNSSKLIALRNTRDARHNEHPPITYNYIYWHNYEFPTKSAFAAT